MRNAVISRSRYRRWNEKEKTAIRGRLDEIDERFPFLVFFYLAVVAVFREPAHFILSSKNNLLLF